MPENRGIPELPVIRSTLLPDFLLLAIVWAAGVWIAHPIGNFPLNDDWAWGMAVKTLVEEGTFRPLGWTGMPLLTNVLWAAPFCLVAGFSFTALRISTLIASLLGVFAAYLLVREVRGPRWTALLAGLTVGLNPIYFSLSLTFMLDVPFVTILAFSALFLARHLRTGRNRDLVLGMAWVLAGILSRQLAVAVPMAFAVSLVLKRGFAPGILARAVAPAALCLGAQAGFRHWLEATGRLPALFDVKSDEMFFALTHPGSLLTRLDNNILAILVYLGLFLLPVLLAAVRGIPRPLARTTGIVFFVALAGLAARAALNHPVLMPFGGNILLKSGIGPLTLRDTEILGLAPVTALPWLFWMVVTALGLLGGALLVSLPGARLPALARRLRERRAEDGETAGFFLLLVALVYLVPLLASTFFDRYLTALIPLLAAGIVGVCGVPAGSFPGRNFIPRVLISILLVCFFLFSAASARDYLAWNRVRWQALDDLARNTGARPDEIDGGFEFNGLYLYDPAYEPDSAKSWWWVRGDRYLVTFGEVPGYHVLREYRYPRWLRPGTGRLLALQRDYPALR